MNKRKNIIVDGKHGKPILLDIYWNETGESKPIVLFAHGFKGFKDWGTWSRIGEEIVKAGFVFLKMNFSHNGTTADNPLEFGDLDAFGKNNYEIELDDIGSVLDWLSIQNDISKSEIDIDNISLIGHSRGGGVAIIKAYEEERIKRLVTWAAVGTLDWMFKPEMVEKWQKNGVHIIVNGRTKQEMPLYYQLYENFKSNEKRFDIRHALEHLNKPHLIVQGTNDPAIPVTSAQTHHQWNPNSKLILIEGANHVFGGSHPFNSVVLPETTNILLKSTIYFLS